MARRSVEPYRSARDALIAKREAIAAQLDEAERAATRRHGLAIRLALADDALRARIAPALEAIPPTSCEGRWEDMVGDDVTRRCARCDGEAHDLARMTEAEIERLLASSTEPLRRRADGRVVFGSCPPARPRVAWRMVGLLALGLVVGAVGGGAGATRLWRPPMASVAPVPATPPVELAPTPAPMAAPVTPVEAPAPDPGPVTRADLDRHIRWMAPQAWELDRSLVERGLAQGASIGSRTSRILPVERGGRTVGVRVFGVGPHGWLGHLGLRNGDTLLEVNGVSMGDPNELLAAYARLRTERAFFLRLERRGVERLHVYRVVG
ncbi:MAG: hypothetical protein H6719_20395 [Sandaracinaceae bacterium]|nr:hypothetical protein [Sandaracinaceae bacterium]